MKILKCTFEIVDPQLAMNAEFLDYLESTPDPRTIPDRHWTPQVSTSTAEPHSIASVLDQYRQLSRWQAEGRELVRNVRLWTAEEPQWREIGGNGELPEVIEMGDIP